MKRVYRNIAMNDRVQMYYWRMAYVAVRKKELPTAMIRSIGRRSNHIGTCNQFWRTVTYEANRVKVLEGTCRCKDKSCHNCSQANNEAYVAFVKRQIHLIDALDDDMKVDYFAALTRCFLLTDLDGGVYFKLCKFQSICTPEELVFIEKCPYDFKSSNTAIISALFQYGLFTQDEDSDTILRLKARFRYRAKI